MANLTITPTDQLTILDLLDHYRRTTDPSKDIYLHNKQSLLVKVNNNKIDNNHFRDQKF